MKSWGAIISQWVINQKWNILPTAHLAAGNFPCKSLAKQISRHFDEKDLDVEIMEDSISSNTESGRYDEHYDRSGKTFTKILHLRCMKKKYGLDFRRDIECELFGNEHDTSEDSF